MPNLPPTAVPYFRSIQFTEQSAPEPLLRAHTTKPGVWARIVVPAGRLRHRMLDSSEDPAILTPERDGIVEPGVTHRLEIDEPVRFFIEFLRDEAVLRPLHPSAIVPSTVAEPG